MLIFLILINFSHAQNCSNNSWGFILNNTCNNNWLEISWFKDLLISYQIISSLFLILVLYWIILRIIFAIKIAKNIKNITIISVIFLLVATITKLLNFDPDGIYGFLPGIYIFIMGYFPLYLYLSSFAMLLIFWLEFLKSRSENTNILLKKARIIYTSFSIICLINIILAIIFFQFYSRFIGELIIFSGIILAYIIFIIACPIILFIYPKFVNLVTSETKFSIKFTSILFFIAWGILILTLASIILIFCFVHIYNNIYLYIISKYLVDIIEIILISLLLKISHIKMGFINLNLWIFGLKKFNIPSAYSSSAKIGQISRTPSTPRLRNTEN